MLKFPLWGVLVLAVAISSLIGAPSFADTGSNLSLSDDENGLFDSETDNMPAAREPEPQVATGKFLTALEVKPILNATKGNWVALRDFNGQDLLYFSHLVAWRCGLFEIWYSVNDGKEKIFDVEPCYVDTAHPGAMKLEDHLPYISLTAGSVETVEISILYDDGTTDRMEYARRAIMMP